MVKGGATRRGVLAAGGAAAAASGTAHADSFAVGDIESSLRRYIGFGLKHAGGVGDEACGAWLEGELRGAGYAVTRQAFDTPYFQSGECALVVGDARTPVLAQAIVGRAGVVNGPLLIGRQETTAAAMRGTIVIAPLSWRRWSTALAPEISSIIAAAARAGAAAVVLVTTGPTGEAVALNVNADRTWPLPVAILAPKAAAPVLAAAERGTQGILVITGQGGVRPAFNLVATMDRRKGKRVIISTPRSGWTICAGERGGGVAAWLALAKWAAGGLPDNDLTFVCTTAHEYEYHGGEKFLASALAPKPADTHLWAHLGANFAARDWHDFGGQLAPLPSVDTQRVLMGTPDLLPALRETFRGAPGLEAPYPSTAGAAGELASVLHAGYGRAFGIFGAHRFHHVVGDDARCVDARHVADTAVRVRDAIRRLAS